VTRVIAAAEWGGEFDGALDPINSLFRFPPIWELSLFGVDLSINRTILIAWFMTLVCGTLFVLAFRNPTVVPGKLQSLGESAIDFVRQIALDIIGPKGLKFVPLLTTMFVFIFFMNVSKITPMLMLPPTSRMAWPAFLAGLAWLVYVGVGIEPGLLHVLQGDRHPAGGAEGAADHPHADRDPLEPGPAALHAGGATLRQHGRRVTSWS
jgi:F-type H+-transporting ATPase subunit a